MKSPNKKPKMATRLLQRYKANLPQLQAWAKNITLKMDDSKFWNKNKQLKAKLTNQNKRKMN